MQGTLNEIDIRSILQLIELGQRTGELFVETTSPSSSSSHSPITHLSPTPSPPDQLFWFVFFINGKIAYAADSRSSNLGRLRDYLRHYKVDNALAEVASPSMSMTTPEYAHLWLLLENQILTPAQGRNIIQGMVTETLFDLLSLHQGVFNFEIGSAIAPQLTTLEIASLSPRIIKQVQQWKQFHPHIQSPDQCPTLTNPQALQTSLPPKAYKSLKHWSDGKTSLRQLSRYLNRDFLTIARAIYPYIQRGWIQLLDSNLPPTRAISWNPPQTQPHIVCIDDDRTIGKSVEYMLTPHSYQVTALTDPLQALREVFLLKPDLILCDIAMPQLDGYELCAMLRSSNTFRQIPILMLTGKEGFIDRVRAKLVGSNDYLTKPFDETELLMLIEKYLT
ncbi:response regulator [Spirulina subsalsa]|uniref:response regulator n=1 Tax=Spirulina subsalsa TaxID=54311 RepID=UPI0003048751|nr:response regulator [Spirulina subsalsa]